MGGQQPEVQSKGSQPVQWGVSLNPRLDAADAAMRDETIPRRLEWIAVILFIVSFVVMMYSYALFISDEAWGLAVVAINMVTAIILLLSVVFSIFSRTNLSKITLGIGIIGLMFLVISIGAKIMQTISEYHDRWY